MKEMGFYWEYPDPTLGLAAFSQIWKNPVKSQ
jgi:hypothetical protein